MPWLLARTWAVDGLFIGRAGVTVQCHTMYAFQQQKMVEGMDGNRFVERELVYYWLP
jgi:hypothetical protein